MFLTVVDHDAAADQIESGSIVVVEHLRLGGSEVEASARELQYFPDRTEFRALPRDGSIDPIVVRNGSTGEPDGKVRICGLVVAATMVL